MTPRAKVPARGAHVFVDETKRRGYLMAAAVLLPRNLDDARRQMRRLCLGSQSRLHFQKENLPRRKLIAATVCRLDVGVVIYGASAITDHRKARTEGLRRLVIDLRATQASRLVIEQDDSLLRADRTDLSRAVHEAQANSLSYEHLPPKLEPLLWIADAAAWCWDHGPEWRGRMRSVVTDVIEVS